MIQMALVQYSKLRVRRHSASERPPSRIIDKSKVEKMQHMALDEEVDGTASRIDLRRAAPEFMHSLLSRAVGERRRAIFGACR
jgi:hypothetical protein